MEKINKEIIAERFQKIQQHICEALEKEDGSEVQAGEQADFKVIEFSKSDKRIVLSHTYTWKEQPEEAKLFAAAKNWNYEPFLSKEQQKIPLPDTASLFPSIPLLPSDPRYVVFPAPAGGPRPAPNSWCPLPNSRSGPWNPKGTAHTPWLPAILPSPPC